MKSEINLFEQEQEEEVCATQESVMELDPNQLRILRRHVQGIIEALLFASSAPLTLDKIREITSSVYPFKPKILKEIIHDLQQEYLLQRRAFRLEEIGGGYLLRSTEEFFPYIGMLHKNRRSEKLSAAAAEVLSIIAYKQPITRPQIDAIRGVDSSGIIQSLLDRLLIEQAGKLEVAGRPTLYQVTQEFLTHFGLRHVDDLPPLN